MIIDAVGLITSEFDRNLVYRQKLAKGENDESFLETTEGIISITVPICAGKEYTHSAYNIHGLSSL